MQLVDSHCHLNYSSFIQDIESVVLRAADAGVSIIIVPGLDLNSSRNAVELANRYNSIYAAVGVHPSDVDTFLDKQLDDFCDFLKDPKVVAIGEIGLDYYHRQDNQKKQKEVLKKMVTLANENEKPIILHSRNSIIDLLGFVKSFFQESPNNHCRGVFHAFEGDLSQASLAANLGFYIGAGGPITYKNAATKNEVFSKIGLGNILLETDSPFLSPQPFRGIRNEPCRIPIIADKLAELQNTCIDVVAEITTNNARNLFKWKD